MSRKFIRIGAFFGMIALIAAVSLGQGIKVLADEDGDDREVENFIEGKGKFKFDKFPKHLEKTSVNREPALTINPNGKTLITAGEVSAVNWPNVTVKVWGINLAVKITDTTVLIGKQGTATSTTATTTAQASVGDKVDVLGEINKSTGEITAKHFKNRSRASQEVGDLEKRIQDLLRQIETLRAQLKKLNSAF